MNQIENDLLDFCKKVEVYIQSSSDYKGDIICGNFSTRFYNLVRTDDRAKDIIFHFDVLNDEISHLKKEIEDFKDQADILIDKAEVFVDLHANGQTVYHDSRAKLKAAISEYKELYVKYKD